MERARMTERQKRFADYYIESGNARQSAIRAGFTPNYAVRLLKMPVIHEYTRQRLGAMDNERIASAEEVLGYLTSVMRGEDGKPDSGRIKAAELLGRRLGAFNEQESEYDVVPIIVDDILGCGKAEGDEAKKEMDEDA